MTAHGVDARALGLALGTLWGLAVALLAVVSRTGWGAEWRDLLAEVYLGYDETTKGATVGAVWGFVDGFVGGVVLGGLYNRFAQK